MQFDKGGGGWKGTEKDRDLLLKDLFNGKALL